MHGGMAYMNGYFQLQTSEQGVSLLLSPPTGDGERIRVAELKEYLNSVGVPYDVKAINSALLSVRRIMERLYGEAGERQWRV